MILIPEIQTVVILVPRTGSGSLRRAIAAKYPQSVLLYRHMEADGVPAGYDRWRKVGVIRDPIERLWSLYKFCQRFREKFGEHSDQDQAYVEAIIQSVDMPFSDWIVKNQLPFTNPYDAAGKGRFWPQYAVASLAAGNPQEPVRLSAAGPRHDGLPLHTTRLALSPTRYRRPVPHERNTAVAGTAAECRSQGSRQPFLRMGLRANAQAGVDAVFRLKIMSKAVLDLADRVMLEHSRPQPPYCLGNGLTCKRWFDHRNAIADLIAERLAKKVAS